MDSRLEHFALRLVDTPFFLASALQEYAQSEGLNGDGLAAQLGCSRDNLGPLGLCRRPRNVSEDFRRDVRMIAERFSIREEVLAAVVRRSDALNILRTGGAGEMLAAARDRDEDGSVRIDSNPSGGPEGSR